MELITKKMAILLNEIQEKRFITVKSQVTYESFSNKRHFMNMIKDFIDSEFITTKNNGDETAYELTFSGDILRMALNKYFKIKKGFWDVLEP